jgi:hypothetical protein
MLATLGGRVLQLQVRDPCFDLLWMILLGLQPQMLVVLHMVNALALCHAQTRCSGWMLFSLLLRLTPHPTPPRFHLLQWLRQHPQLQPPYCAEADRGLPALLGD